ncbi:YqjF family protein [Telluribacter sp. SYSU D00476]|uniref:YqjF family protein n=1 Tax=Telluribacter sp. SYSU D00476 TaxID=2811430 RepID=UPI001FF6E06E|nr:DUF2071 domain-containing protein [Telluribacter sp. SYSU D00476]
MGEDKNMVVISARWDYLLFLNYEVDPTILLPYLPRDTQIETWQGKTLVSVVGFLFDNIKVLGIKWPLHVNFEEINLRFYVRYFDGRQWKRGVVFISQIVPRPTVPLVANTLLHENYTYMPVRHAIIEDTDSLGVNYEWESDAGWNRMAVQADRAAQDITPGSEEEFILINYWGYNKYTDRTTVEYEVEHPYWKVYPIRQWEFNCKVADVYGKEFEPYLLKSPHSVMLARGSDIIMRRPSPIN